MYNIGRLAVKVKVLSLGDSVGKASEAVRASTVGAAPVVHEGRLMGVITAGNLAELLSHVAPEQTAALTVAALPLDGTVPLPESLSARDALTFLRSSALPHAPVVEPGGGLIGMISEAELVSALCGRVKPPIIGGMATPFGVYLAGGGVRGGVGDLALVSTGVYIMVLQLLALWATDSLIGHPSSIPLVGVGARWLDKHPQLFGLAFGALLGLFFGLLFRISWITGYHAAEHQVVHTLEAGDDLLPQVVARKPRVHPRCGTNLVAAFLLMSIFWTYFREYGVVLGMIVTFFLWRPIGSWIQQHVTTRPATPLQLESGIVAAKQLLERYQAQPPPARGPWRRIWQMGLLQVLCGYAIVMGTLWLLHFAGVSVPESLLLAG